MCRMIFYEGCHFDLFTLRRFFEDQVLPTIVLHFHTIYHHFPFFLIRCRCFVFGLSYMIIGITSLCL